LIRFIIAAGIVCAGLSGPARAQQSAQPDAVEQFNRKTEANIKKLRPGWVQTVFVPLKLSLTDLLNSGWTISNGAPGTGFVLQQGNKWAICEIDDGREFGSPPSSHCVSLN
jgi:hypothetical protein